MYCPRCKYHTEENHKFCPNCGESLTTDKVQTSLADPPYDVRNESSTLINIIAFFFPLIGIIIYFVHFKEMPGRAKSALRGVVARIIASIILILILGVSYISLLKDIFGYLQH